MAHLSRWKPRLPECVMVTYLDTLEHPVSILISKSTELHRSNSGSKVNTAGNVTTQNCDVGTAQKSGRCTESQRTESRRRGEENQM